MSNNSHNLLTRRSLLQFAGAALANTLLTSRIARAGNRIPFGAAVALDPFRNDPIFRQMLIEHVDVIVPMNALKWASLRHEERKFDFSGADEIIEFAEKHGKKIHGHAPLWYHANPAWLDAITSSRRLESLIFEHITEVVGRYAGRVGSWDVVNEVIAHDPMAEGPWRTGVWFNALGPRHIELAFKAASQADPLAKLYINDYDLQDAGPRVAARQDAILNIVQNLQNKNIPVHGIGLQSHLYAERRVGRDNLQRFVEVLKSRGLTVSVTELDVIDWKLSADQLRRDRGVAHTANEYLSALTDVITPQTITTWGLCDRYSWINTTFPRDDGALARPLPFDRDWNSKPLFDVIRSFAG